jgi:hypothetical protein
VPTPVGSHEVAAATISARAFHRRDIPRAILRGQPEWGRLPPLTCPKRNCCNWTTANLPPLHQSLSSPDQMHALQARREFLLVSHKAFPILMLAQWSLCTPPGVQPQRHDLPGVMPASQEKPRGLVGQKAKRPPHDVQPTHCAAENGVLSAFGRVTAVLCGIPGSLPEVATPAV